MLSLPNRMITFDPLLRLALICHLLASTRRYYCALTLKRVISYCVTSAPVLVYRLTRKAVHLRLGLAICEVSTGVKPAGESREALGCSFRVVEVETPHVRLIRHHLHPILISFTTSQALADVCAGTMPNSNRHMEYSHPAADEGSRHR